MSFLQRLRNLWRLSEWEPSNSEIEAKKEGSRSFAPLTREPKKMAQIIKMKTPVKEFLEKNHE